MRRKGAVMEIDIVDHKGGGVVMVISKLLIAKRREVKLSGTYQRPSARQERRARAQDPCWHQRMCPVFSLKRPLHVTSYSAVGFVELHSDLFSSNDIPL